MSGKSWGSFELPEVHPPCRVIYLMLAFVSRLRLNPAAPARSFVLSTLNLILSGSPERALCEPQVHESEQECTQGE